jgi:hypothetical protein
MSTPDYKAHLAELRANYVRATPRQRLGIARQRIANPEHGPNTLIAHVSAVEGFARCLAMHVGAKSQADLSALYPAYRNMGPERLIEEYLSSQGLGEPSAYFGPELWQLFLYAIEYRNLLAHECTYLGQDMSPGLISACTSILDALARSKGLQ